MKKLLHSFALVLALAGASQARAGIPVLDAANLANSLQQVIAWGQQYTQMVQSIQQLQAQYVQLQNTYNSLTGPRGLSTLLNGASDQAMRRYLPEQGEDIDQLARGAAAGYGTLQSAISSTRRLVSTMPSGTFGSGSEALNVLSAKVNSLATQRALGQAAFTAASRRFNDIEGLISTSGGANDPKAIAEMQTRITAQQALLQNESAKLQAMAYMQAAERQQNEQRAAERLANGAQRLDLLSRFEDQQHDKTSHFALCASYYCSSCDCLQPEGAQDRRVLHGESHRAQPSGCRV